MRVCFPIAQRIFFQPCCDLCEFLSVSYIETLCEFCFFSLLRIDFISFFFLSLIPYSFYCVLWLLAAPFSSACLFHSLCFFLAFSSSIYFVSNWYRFWYFSRYFIQYYYFICCGFTIKANIAQVSLKFSTLLSMTLNF